MSARLAYRPREAPIGAGLCSLSARYALQPSLVRISAKDVEVVFCELRLETV
jgi:hypothetical protein